MKGKVVMVATKKQATTKKSPLAGRNRYAQKCNSCGEMVPSSMGFLEKRPKGFSSYEVYHELCKPARVTHLETPSSNIVSILEAKLIDRQLKGEPIDMLPKIIDYIKDLEAKVEKYA